MRIQLEDVGPRGPAPGWLEQRLNWEQRQVKKLQPGPDQLRVLMVIEQLEQQLKTAHSLWASSPKVSLKELRYRQLTGQPLSDTDLRRLKEDIALMS